MSSALDRIDVASFTSFMTHWERPQKTTLAKIAEAAETLEQLRLQAELHERVFRSEIRTALVEGVAVVDIAKAARLSRERIYQIRDGRR